MHSTSHTAGPAGQLTRAAAERESLLREASDAQTSPPRLAQLAYASPDRELSRLLAQNPNTPASILWMLAATHPREVLENPVLPLLHLENANLGHAIPESAALALLSSSNLPAWMLEAFHSGPINPKESVREALRQHHQIDNKDEAQWAQFIRAAFLEAAEIEVLKSPNYLYGTPCQDALKQGQVPDWLGTLLIGAVQKLALREFGEANFLSKLPADESGDGLSAISRRASLAIEKFREEKKRRAAEKPPTPQQQANSNAGPSQKARQKQARNATATPEELAELAQDEAREVRISVVRHPNTSLATLEQLAGDDDSWVRGALARNKDLPLHLLERLASDSHSVVRINVARHPHATVELLQQLAGDDDGEVLHALWHRGDLPEPVRNQVQERQKSVSQWGTSRAAKNVALSNQTPPHVLDQLAKLHYADEMVCKHIASNKKATPATLRRLGEHNAESVRAALAANPNTPHDLLERFSRDSLAVRQGLASNANAPQELLQALVDANLRLPNSFHEKLALNPALPLSALEKLSNQVAQQRTGQAVKQAWEISMRFSHAERHPNFFPSGSHSSFPLDSYYKASRRNYGIKTSSQDIVNALLVHPQSSAPFKQLLEKQRRESMLFDLAESDNVFERSIALSHPELPLEILEAHLYAPKWIWRVAVCANPSVPAHFLEILATDGDRFVRACAKARLEKMNSQ